MDNIDLDSFLDVHYKSGQSKITPSFRLVSEEQFDNCFNYKFEIICKPCWGYTFGNTVRRVALTSLSGYAPIAFYLQGAKHLFDQISGVKEIVGDIVLRLKKIILKPKYKEEDHSTFPKVHTLTIEKDQYTGPIYNKDLENEFFSVVNGDDVLLTLDHNSSINMKILVAQGEGYRKAQEHVVDNISSNYFLIDSNFSFISKLSFEVHNETSLKDAYDRVDINIESKIPFESPEHLIARIISVAIEEFSSFATTETVKQRKQEAKKEENLERWQLCLIENTNLQIRTKNTFINKGITTVGQLLEYSAQEIKSLNGIGETSFEDLLRFLKENSLRLKNSQDRFIPSASNTTGE